MADTTGRGLTLRQRRAMGLTVRNMARAARELAADGSIDKDTPREDVAELVLEKIVTENPKAFADPGVDWDAILAFIEKLLPLILAIISMFGGL